MIERIMNLNHFTYKKPFSGSDKGNRFKYIIQMVPEDDVKRFHVKYWTKETNSKVTPAEDITEQIFEFSEEGYDAALKWLNEESSRFFP